MSGKAKSCYVSVTSNATRKTVLNKMFFVAKDMNAFVNSDEFKAKYPPEQYTVSKETY